MKGKELKQLKKKNDKSKNEWITSNAIDVISNRQGRPAVMTDATTNEPYAFVLPTITEVISDDAVNHTLSGAGLAVSEQSLASK